MVNDSVSPFSYFDVIEFEYLYRCCFDPTRFMIMGVFILMDRGMEWNGWMDTLFHDDDDLK